jgi:anti-sigma regulatory factor (Ser/Thr protein kinase)/serine/threonine protein phosphatase PrpC
MAVPPIDVRDEASVALAREHARALAAEVGLSREAAESLAIVVSELGMNQLRHARLGELALGATMRAGIPGVEVVALDSGEGIADPTAAVRGEATGASAGLGAGLGGVLRLADEVDVAVRWGAGTAVAARKFARTPPRKSEVALVSRPCDGEVVCGDEAAFARLGDVLLVGVADGLGHGRAARDASARAAGVLRDAVERGLPERASPDGLLREVDAALRDTRGAVMSVARLDRDRGVVEHAGLGNVAAQLVRPTSSHRFAAAAGVLGNRRPSPPPLPVESAPLGPGDTLVLFTDGLTGRATLADDRELARQHPLVVAHQLLVRFGRTNDDALVLVAR